MTLSVTIAAWVRTPAVPVKVTVAGPTTVPTDAVIVMVCGMPGWSTGEEGETVTPAGRPLMATVTAELKPFMAASVRVIEPPVPATTLMVLTEVLREKSAVGSIARLDDPELQPATASARHRESDRYPEGCFRRGQGEAMSIR